MEKHLEEDVEMTREKLAALLGISEEALDYCIKQGIEYEKILQEQRKSKNYIQ